MIFLLTCLFLIHYGHAYVPPFNLARGSNVALVTPFDSYGKIDFNDGTLFFYASETLDVVPPETSVNLTKIRLYSMLKSKYNSVI